MKYLSLKCIVLVLLFQNVVNSIENKKKTCDQVKEHQSSSDYWIKFHQEEIQNEQNKFKHYLQSVATKKAKNIILFIGDGMNIATITATRVHKARKDKNGCGEETILAMDKLPTIGISKTYAVDRQTPDSASTATAIYNGVKGSYLTLGKNGHTQFSRLSSTNYASWFTTDDRSTCTTKYSIMKMLKEDRGVEDFKTGIITTTHFAHATPAALYSCWASRFNYKKIATFFEDSVLYSKTIDISLGGGKKYLTKHLKKAARKGKIKVPFTKQALNEIENLDKPVVGLFNHKYMEYENNRKKEREPSFPEMVSKTIHLLKNNNKKGFFLMAEAGKIDKAHHENLATAALEETRQLDIALEQTLEIMKDELDETLIIVTADHGHTFTVAGYGDRGTHISEFQNLTEFSKYLQSENIHDNTLGGYYTGPGHHMSKKYFHETTKLVKSAMFDGSNYSDKVFKSTINVQPATHSSEDVPIFAGGPFSHLLNGVHEQSYISHVMKYAGCAGKFGKYANHCK